MDDVHPLTALGIALLMVLTAEWFVRRERSLFGSLLKALGS